MGMIPLTFSFIPSGGWPANVTPDKNAVETERVLQLSEKFNQQKESVQIEERLDSLSMHVAGRAGNLLRRALG